MDTYITANTKLQNRLAQLHPSDRCYSQSQAQRLIQHCWTLFLSTLTTAMRSWIKYSNRTEYNYYWYSDAAVHEQHKLVCQVINCITVLHDGCAG